MNTGHMEQISKPSISISTFIRGMVMLFVFSPFFWSQTAEAKDLVTLKYKIKESYTMGPGDSEALAHKLALFRAKRKAADQAAHEFARQKLIQFEKGDQNELVALVAENLRYTLLFDQWESKDDQRTYIVDIQSQVKLSDFIDAQLDIFKFEEKKATDDFREEMEPSVPDLLKPGRALAKAYWLIRIDELRMAIIYLDALIHQYPNWQEAYDVKRMAAKQQHGTGHKALLDVIPWSVPLEG